MKITDIKSYCVADSERKVYFIVKVATDQRQLARTGASVDYVTADTIMAIIKGYDPADIGYLYYANREGLGVGDLSQINVVGGKISNVKHVFTPHRETADVLQWKQSEWYS